jgi:hypothetical protein
MIYKMQRSGNAARTNGYLRQHRHGPKVRRWLKQWFYGCIRALSKNELRDDLKEQGIQPTKI